MKKESDLYKKIRIASVSAEKEDPEMEDGMCTGACAIISGGIKDRLDKTGIASNYIDVGNSKYKAIFDSDHSALYLPKEDLIVDTQVWQFTSHDGPEQPLKTTRKIVFTPKEYSDLGFTWKEVFSKGGQLIGASHSEGGIDIVTPNGKIEAEGGEVIINKEATAANCELLSEINQSAGNGVAFNCNDTCEHTEEGATAAKGRVIKGDEYVYIGFFKDGQLVSTQRILLSELGEEAHAKLSDSAADKGLVMKTIYKELYHNHSPFDKYTIQDLEEYYKTQNKMGTRQDMVDFINKNGLIDNIKFTEPNGENLSDDQIKMLYTNLINAMNQKKITIHDYNKFMNTQKGDLKYENLYRSGYWNVFKYSTELENFLKENNIDHSVKEIAAHGAKINDNLTWDFNSDSDLSATKNGVIFVIKTSNMYNGDVYELLANGQLLKEGRDIFKLKQIAENYKPTEMKNNYYYLKIGNVIKEPKFNNSLRIVSLGRDGMKVADHSKIMKNNKEEDLDYTTFVSYMNFGDITIEGCAYETDRDKILLQMEIDNIKSSFEKDEIKDSVKKAIEEVTIKKIGKSGKASKAKKELKAKTTAFKDTVAGLEAIVTKESGGWQKGTTADYEFEAKVYDEPSEYGIENGRVSKLWVYKVVNGKKQTAFNYDRGWDVKATTVKDKKVLKTILDKFPIAKEQSLHDLIDKFAKMPTWKSTGLSQITPGKYELFVSDLREANETRRGGKFTDEEDLENYVMTNMDLRKYIDEEDYKASKGKKIDSDFHIGEVVQVTRGHYKGKNGTISDLDVEKNHVEVTMGDEMVRFLELADIKKVESGAKPTKMVSKPKASKGVKVKKKSSGPKRGKTTLSERNYMKKHKKDFDALKDAYPDFTYKALIAKHNKYIK